MQQNADSLSLVMLDLIMPNMNGFEVLEAMNSDSELKALQMGADDFITKPIEPKKSSKLFRNSFPDSLNPNLMEWL